MPQWWQGRGFGLTVLMLYALATLRGQGTYWLARLVTEQSLRRTRPRSGWRARAHRWLLEEGVGRGRASLQRWGLVVVPLCYLTIGLQTVVLAAAGVLRIGWLRFTLAQAPGALAWALIYATIGFAVWHAAVVAAAGSPGALASLAGLAVVLGAALVVRRHRARARAGGGSSAATPDHQPGRQGPQHGEQHQGDRGGDVGR